MSFAGVMPGGRAAAQHYDPAKEITIQATVQNIATGSGRMHAVVWTARAEDRNPTVFLGPASFVKEKMESKKLSVTVGDQGGRHRRAAAQPAGRESSRVR
jgi:hypothetical protein